MWKMRTELRCLLLLCGLVDVLTLEDFGSFQIASLDQNSEPKFPLRSQLFRQITDRAMNAYLSRVHDHELVAAKQFKVLHKVDPFDGRKRGLGTVRLPVVMTIGNNETPRRRPRILDVPKRQGRRCDARHITVAILIEFLKTGRICNETVKPFRFGLGVRK